MRTTIIIDDQLIADLMRESQAASRSEAVRQAIESYLILRRKARFKSLAGSRISDLDWRAMEANETRELDRG